MSNLYWLTDEQLTRLQPYFPTGHGKPRVDDRRVLSGIIFVNRNGLRWCDAPSAFGPRKTLYNRWKRWGDRRVSDETYMDCETILGRDALVAVVLLAAAYAGTCTILNAFAVPAP